VSDVFLEGAPVRRQTLLAAFAVALTLPADSALAAQGLTESVWRNIPEYDYAPTPQDITKEQTWSAANAPAYSFLNSVDGFNYGSDNAQTIAGWFGADAAGAALNDANAPGDGYFAFDASGYIFAPVAGTYTFDLGATFNQVDDAARVTVDGQIVAEQNFQATYADYSDAVYLTAGYHAFDLFYFQTQGGYGLGFAGYGRKAIAA